MSSGSGGRMPSPLWKAFILKKKSVSVQFHRQLLEKVERKIHCPPDGINAVVFIKLNSPL